MTDIPAQAIVALGAVSAALIAGCFSFLNLVVSKEQKVSEFRQDWIDAFRLELSELTAAVFHISYHLAAYENDRERKTAVQEQTVASTLRESHETYSRTVTSLLLRINPDERNTKKAKMNSEFLAAFQAVRDAFNTADFSKASHLCSDLRQKAAPILKSEWERVKSGERAYRVSKWVAATVLAAGFVGIGFIAANWRTYQPASLPPNPVVAPANTPLQPTQ